jgi:Flp pilus assembly protein TadD
MALQRYVEATAAYRDCRDTFLRLQSLDQRDRGALKRANDDEIRALQQTINEIRAGHIKSASPERDIVQAETRIQVLERSNQSTDPSTPVPPELELALGSAYFRQGKLEDAEREYREAIKANDKFGEAYNNLAVVYMMTGRLAEAQEAVRRAEKAGFQVSSRFKDDLKRQQAGDEAVVVRPK